MRASLILCSVAVASTLTGCTHRQLRSDHVKQARTLTTIMEQQVLDNLAMFVSNPDALPFFALPAAGSATVTDSGSLAAGPLNGNTSVGPLGLSRDNQQNWTMAPVTDPDKLTRMRAQYQATLPLLNIEVGGHAVASECDKTGSWCGCHITVCPESYAALTQLTLAILDIAVNDPAPAKPKPTIEVEDFIYDAGNTRIEEIQRYTRDMDGNVVARPEATEGEEKSNLSKSLLMEQQRNLLRNSLFPN